MNKSIVLIFTVLAFTSSVGARTFTFVNKCPYTVWPGALNGAGHPLPLGGGWTLLAGQSNVVGTPDDWNGRFWGRTKCSFDTSGHGQCETGDCGGQLACNGAGGVPPATLAEFTLDGSSGLDFFDLSLVDGYNLPMAITPSTSCPGPSCTSDLNKSCPQELQEVIGGNVVACLSACEKFNTDQYCCRGAYSTPQTCLPTNYSEIFKAACPTAYSYAYDDKSSTFTCVGANYVITFCP